VPLLQILSRAGFESIQACHAIVAVTRLSPKLCRSDGRVTCGPQLSRLTRNGVRHRNLLKGSRIRRIRPFFGVTMMSSPSNPNSQSGFRQAAAAEQNRQHRARVAIMQAIMRLGIPRNQWPDFIEAHYAEAPHGIPFRQIISPSAFQAPVFDRLNQSPKEWSKQADAQWEQHRDRFLEGCDVWVTAGVDEKIFITKGRGPGKSQRLRTRHNTALELRYEWAARRSCGEAWKEIAFRSDAKESTVIKAASEVLGTAGWPTKPAKTN
jgi:hypothetical protein